MHIAGEPLQYHKKHTECGNTEDTGTWT